MKSVSEAWHRVLASRVTTAVGVAGVRSFFTTIKGRWLRPAPYLATANSDLSEAGVRYSRDVPDQVHPAHPPGHAKDRG